MTIKILADAEDFDSNVTQIDAWYDRHTRLWCIQLKNKDGDQIGDAVWCYGKTDKDMTVKQLRDEYGL